MPLLTTTIGSYPKPPHAPVPASFDGAWRSTADVVDRVLSERDREEIDRAVHEVVAEQVAIGIDVPTDGEIRREHYIYYHCRHLGGFDFDGLEAARGGRWGW